MDAFLYSNGTMTDLGNLGDSFAGANSINKLGEIVGYSIISPRKGHAFFYSSSTGIKDLNTLYASLLVSGVGPQKGFATITNAISINNSGEIVGYGAYWNGTSNLPEAFLLDPGPTILRMILQWGMAVLGVLLLITAIRWLV